MTVPAFLSGSVYYKETTGMTDVNTMISDLETVLITNLSWTEPSADEYKSPVDAAGRFLKVIVSRVDAGTLSWLVKDQNGNTVCDRRITIDTGGTTVRYYGSAFGILVESAKSTPELAIAGMLDFSPGAQSANTEYVYGVAPYDNTGGADGNVYPYLFTRNTSNASSQRIVIPTTGSVATPKLITKSGTYLFTPAEMIRYDDGSGEWQRVGRAYNWYLCAAVISDDTELSVPVDDTTNKTFRVVRGTTYSTNFKLCVRKD